MLKGFNLVIWVKGRISAKGGRAGKELSYVCWFAVHVRHSLWTFGWRAWVRGHFAEGNSERAGGPSAYECSLLILVKYNFNLGVGILWENRP